MDIPCSKKKMLIYLQISNFFFKLWQNSQGLQMSFLLSENVNFICLKRIINCLNSTLILYPIWNCQIVLNIFFLFPLYTDIRLDWLVENVFCFFNFLHVIDIPSLRWKVLIYLRQRSNSFFSNFGKIPKTYECQCHCLKSIINCLNVEGILPHLTRSDF